MKDKRQPLAVCIIGYTSELQDGKVKGVMQIELVQKLMGEKWMPQLEGSYEYEDVLRNLFSKLSDNNPMIYDSVMNYLAALFK